MIRNTVIIILLTLTVTLRGADANDQPSLQQLIDQAWQKHQSGVTIPPGTYHLSADGKSGHHLNFSGLKNFSIEAANVTLVFVSRDKSSIGFKQCDNVTLHGVTLLRETAPFSQGKILAISADGKTIDVQVDRGYPADFDNPQFFPKIVLNLFNPQNRQWLDDKGEASSVERLGPDTFRVHQARAVNSQVGWIVGAAVAWRGLVRTDIDINDCHNMKITDLTISGGAGFCVHEHGGLGGNTYRYTVTYGGKPTGATEQPLIASNADAFHSSGVRQGPTLEDCHFEGMNDDGVPIHGSYALTMESASNQIIVEVRYPPFCQTGDRMRFNDERGISVAEAKVTNIEPLPDYQLTTPPPKALRLFQDFAHPKFFRLTLDQSVPAKSGWLVANGDMLGNGFVIRHCTIRNNRARGMLIKAGDGLIEDCTIQGSSMGGIVVAPEMGVWNESDYARNLIIRRNTIERCNYWSHPGNSQAGALTVNAYEYGRFVPSSTGGHRNILIKDNTFINNDGPNIVITSASDVTIRNNRFLQPMTHPSTNGSGIGIDPGSLFWFDFCIKLTISGNTYSNPGPYFKSPLTATATVNGSGFDNGIKLEP
ncbi:MAG: right-handed parallel beta-helix repeat-containing protein [Verrucomicrobiales bacterium]|jgi:acetyltransferase-like isoleucine patch superfamily enzyme|nr:right-handed parallel beta-helix repeat-containing protein [Verrucomicrobiales bacterium]